MAVDDTGPANEFRHIPHKGNGTGLDDSFIKDVLRGSQFCRFRYTSGFHKMAPEQLLRDLFSSPEVGAALQRVDDSFSKHNLSGAVSDVEWEHVKASVTSMAFFDRLETCDPPIARGGGRLARCMDEVHDDITVSDELRKLLVAPDESEHAELFSPEDKSEFLFRIFRCLAVGGAMSQYEDNVTPYTEAAKRLYKALVAVQKNPATQNVEVTSAVYLVKGVTAQEGWSLFPQKRRDSRNFCFVCVDQQRYTATVWYHVAQSVW